MLHSLEARAADYVMPDVMKIGGVSGWLRAAELAREWDVPMSNHLWPEISAQLLCCTPTAHWLEYTDWWNPVLAEPLRVEGGMGSFWYESQIDESTLMLIPEVGVAFQAPRSFPIHFGLGVGHTLIVNGPETAEPALYGAVDAHPDARIARRLRAESVGLIVAVTVVAAQGWCMSWAAKPAPVNPPLRLSIMPLTPQKPGAFS